MMNENKRLAKRWVVPALLACASAALVMPPARAADLTGSYAWKPVKIGAGGWMRGMVVHPANAAVRYSRGDVDNIYRWDNTNSVWVPMKVSGVLPSNVTAAPTGGGSGPIAVDPSNQNVVLCAWSFGRSGDITGTYPSIGLNVYRSTNGGVTFTAGNMSLSGSLENETRGERMAIDPNNGNVVYFGSPSNGLWRSMDGGLTWSNVTANGAPGSTSNAVLPRFDGGAGTVSFSGQAVSKRIYITMDAGSILRSDDGGNSWTNISSGQSIDGHPGFATVGSDGRLWVANTGSSTISIYSRAGGWSTTTPPHGADAIAIDSANASRVFVMSGGGNLARTTNGGTSWTDLGGSLNYSTTQAIQWLRPSSIRPQGHYLSEGGMYMDKNGNLWVPGANDGIITATPNDATDSSSNPPIWSSSSQGIEEMVGEQMVIPPGGKPILSVEDETLFTISNPDLFTAAHYPISLWNSNNGLSSAQDIAYCPNQPRFMVVTSDNCFAGSPQASTSHYSGYSSDGGTSWTQFGSITGGTHPCVLYDGIIAVSARASGHQNDGPGSDNIVWLSSNNFSLNSFAPFYSTNGGATWTQSASFNSAPGASVSNQCGVNYELLGWQWGAWNPALKQHNIEADPLTPGTFYMDLAAGGFWKSTDKGVTWTQMAATNLPSLTHHGQLRVNPNASGDLWYVDGYEGATAHGLYHTTDGGATFTRNAAFTWAWALALGKSSTVGGYPAIYVYGKLASDANWGIFRSTDTGATWDRVSFYPTGLLDTPSGLAASWDTFGLVYVSFRGNSFVYGTPSGPTAPPAPTGLTATAGNTQVTLNWTASSGATSYNVYRGTTSGGENTTAIATGIATTTYTNTGLTNGTTYYYKATATNSTGTSGYSNEASAQPSAPVPQAQIAAGTPTIDGNVDAIWGSATSYSLTKTTGTVSGSSDCSASWQGLWDSTNLYILVSVTDDVKKNDSTNPWDDDAIELYLDADHNGGTAYDANDRQIVCGWGDAAAVEGAGRSITGVTFATADPTGTTYRIEAKIPWAVEAFTPAANSIIGIDVHVDDDDDGGARDGKVIWNDGTDQAWTNPSLFGTGKLLAGGAPPAPTGLTATPGNTQVAFSWSASSGATSYNVLRSTVSGSGYASVATGIATTSYTNTGLTNGTTYYFVVTATNSSGTSGNSNQAGATPAAAPAAPTGLTAVPGIAQVWLTWTASGGATTYNVKRSTVSGSGYATAGSPATATFMNTGLTNGTTYYFVVTAVSSGGESANSSQASAAPSATVPQAQIASGTATIDGTVEAAWSNAPAYLLSKTTGTISSYADCTATWQGMWDATNLYILAKVTDDVKTNDSTNPWDDDSIEIYLDADHNGGTTYDANDRQIVCGWGDAAAVEGGGRAISGVAFGKSDPTGTSYIIEAKIPWAVEAFTPAANNVIGIDVHVNDDDDGGARDGKVIWNDGTDMAWGNPSLFGAGKLNGAHPATSPSARRPAPTVRRRDTILHRRWMATPRRGGRRMTGTSRTHGRSISVHRTA